MAEKQLVSSLSDDLSQRLGQYLAMKNLLSDFALDAEDDLATALEAFSAEQLSRWAKPTLSGLNRTELAIDMFLSEGQVANRPVIELFMQSEPELSAAQQTWLRRWLESFHGLFVVRDVAEGRYELMNWLTEKTYCVYPAADQVAETLVRMSPGEIVLARLLPITEAEWTFSGPLTLLGKLGKPKLAVAIGNFKQWFPQHLYGDAPELKEAAWDSVKQHYDEFVAFFGAEQITLSGYELNQKLQVYQAQMSEKQLAEAGIDSNKSLKELAQDAGLSEEEVTEAVEVLGAENKTAKQLMENARSLKMIMPKITLPDELRRAEAVTVFVHPRWGQAFLSDYRQLEDQIAQVNGPSTDEEVADVQTVALDRLVLKYLESERVTAYVWQCLARSHGPALEASLRRVLNRSDFDIQQDLDGVMARYGKPLTPDLPETASVPLHLHNLFQEALQAVGKGASKSSGKDSGPKGRKKKAKKQKKSGFGR